ncbi:unannotated protein [freshwater metagenome]|uniref:Unannotated protein n=1 Tax=freshwater metagenome TaxID=449393 RepID=A0A6J7J859_9ZZZZ
MKKWRLHLARVIKAYLLIDALPGVYAVHASRRATGDPSFGSTIV